MLNIIDFYVTDLENASEKLPDSLDLCFSKTYCTHGFTDYGKVLGIVDVFGMITVAFLEIGEILGQSGFAQFTGHQGIEAMVVPFVVFKLNDS